MIGQDVKLIEYSKTIDRYNCITHALGAVLGVFGTVAITMKASSLRHFISALIYSITLVAVFTVSAVYHGLPQGEAKRIARLVDHSAVPMLIAGTTTPCAMVSLYEIKPSLGITVTAIGWLCALFGLFSKLFFFEKLKKITMAVYIISCVIMLSSVIPVTGQINMGAFGYLVAGCIAYLIGAVLCGLGVKRPVLHVIFHIFVIIGAAVHFLTIHNFVIC